MINIFIQFVHQYPVIATVSLVTCPMLAMAVAGLMDAAKLEFWEDSTILHKEEREWKFNQKV